MTVIVGFEKASFVVHEQLLTYHSPFFRAALNGRFEEATKREVRLKEVNKDTFEFFVHWLYHQRLPNENDDPRLFAMWESGNDRGDSKTTNLVYLNVFCDKYDVPALKRQSLDHLFEHLMEPHTNLPSKQNSMYAFENTPDDSPLCRLLVDTYCDLASEQVWEGIGGEDWNAACEHVRTEVPLTVLKKVLLRCAGKHGPNDDLDICDYHEHRDAKERQACAAKRTA